jgi:NADP-dependent 3-hydroxy acid dehydrogenase YdfG
VLGPITEATVENYTHVFDVNVKGVLLSMKHEIPALLKNGGGAIVNTSSVAGERGFPGLRRLHRQQARGARTDAQRRAGLRQAGRSH